MYQLQVDVPYLKRTYVVVLAIPGESQEVDPEIKEAPHDIIRHGIRVLILYGEDHHGRLIRNFVAISISKYIWLVRL